MIDELREKSKELPQLPGVYLMKDENDDVIYVGKAARLKNRVSSYFRNTDGLFGSDGLTNHDIKTDLMVSKIEDFDTIIVESEFEALVLENSLIKEYMPKYNVKLRDDKGYPFIRVDILNEYPTFKVVPNATEDGALYLGPYGTRSETFKALSAISKALKLPTCGKNIKQILGKQRPCLNHDMGNCRAYCQKVELADDYRNTVAAAIDVFQGKTGSLLKKLAKDMNEASDALNFETAALLRDRIKAIKVLEQKQFFTEDPIEEHAALYKEKILKTHQWLEKALKLTSIPERIEAYDISNTGASNIVGSMIVFIKGKPLKKDYRRFKIRTKRGQDDYGSMAEVVTRRIKRYLAGDEKFTPLPDIMLIDGGVNHASIIYKTLTELDVQVPVFGMVKDEKHRTRALVTPDGDEIGLSANPAVFALIGSIQEEAHRFAIEYHRKLRTKTMLNKDDKSSKKNMDDKVNKNSKKIKEKGDECASN
ncbi:MAG: excinuclease ABC subunit UvrC [Oscillospiraceae bacterium]|nr:excinuclease ABC subunit UvrC [Oscillospiraceae bacterium]